MSFKFGQRVRLTRDLQMRGFRIAKGIEGIVTNVHLQTSVLFDGLEHELVVPDDDIAPVSGKPKNARSEPKTRAPVAAAPQELLAGQRVRLLITKHISGQSIPAGSLGIVTQAAPSMDASWVLFDGFGGDKLIPNGDLQAA